MTDLGLSLGLSLDTRLRFKRAIDCDENELDSVLDYLKPHQTREGYWPDSIIVPDGEEVYKACEIILKEYKIKSEDTIAKCIRRELADKNEGSSSLVNLIAKLSDKIKENK